MEYIKNLQACDDEYPQPIFLNIGIQKTTMAILDVDTSITRPLFFDLSESLSIPTAVFVSDISEKYYFGRSAILAADSGYEGLLFTCFVDDLSLIDNCAVPEMGTNTQKLTNKTLIDAFFRHIVTLLKMPELCVLNKIKSTQILHLFVTVGHIFDQNSSYYYFHSDLSKSVQNGVQLSFVNIKKTFSTSLEINSVAGVHLGKILETDINISAVKCLGYLFSVKLVIKTFLQYVYNERFGKVPSDIISFDLLTLEDLIKKLEGLSDKQKGKAKRITAFANGKEEILLLRKSDKDYFDFQMPITLGNICVNGFVQVRNAVYSYIGRSLTSQGRVLIVPDEYSSLFKFQTKHFQNLDIYSESDVLLLMTAKYQHERKILKKAIDSVEIFKRDIYSLLMNYYQCKEVFEGYLREIKNDIIVPTVRSWGVQRADQSLQQLSFDIDKQVRDRFCYSVNGGKIEVAILQLKESKRIYNVVERCMDSCLASVFGNKINYRKNIGDLFAITDSCFDGWQATIPQSQSIMTCIVNAKGFFDFSNDNLPINISKRSAISNRFISNMDSYCKNYFEAFDSDMHNALSKQIFLPLVNCLCNYLTKQYKLYLEAIIATDEEESCIHQCATEGKEEFRKSTRNKTEYAFSSTIEQELPQICSACGAIVNGKFCGRCGTKYVLSEFTKPIPPKKCLNCGATVNGKFCGKCGTKY